MVKSSFTGTFIIVSQLLQFYLTLVVSLTATAVVTCANDNEGMFYTFLSLFNYLFRYDCHADEGGILNLVILNTYGVIGKPGQV
jgi:hypothetical protein